MKKPEALLTDPEIWQVQFHGSAVFHCWLNFMILGLLVIELTFGPKVALSFCEFVT